MKTLIICLLLIGCTKPPICEVFGTYRLDRTMKDGQVVCQYNQFFYYRYEFAGQQVLCTQVIKGNESTISESSIDCHQLYMVTKDSMYYGNPIEYSVLIKN